MSKLPRLDVGRYQAYPEGIDWVGWIEPENKEWIVFIRDKHIEVYNCDSKGVVGEPAVLDWHEPVEA